MENLHIEQTKSTPGISFDTSSNRLHIEGQSYPENAFKFYEPIFTWLDEYLCDLNEKTILSIYFHMPYINTSSSKCIMMILDRMETAYKDGKKITIHWYYDEENDTALECAEEFKEDLVLPFEILAVSDNE